jgi:Na+/proline symporter
LAAGIALAALLVGAYSVVGGLLADAVTDVIQGIAVLLGLIILGVIVVAHVGGISAGLAQLEPERLQLFTAEDSVLQILERLAIPVCGTIVAVELISRVLGARTGDIAATGTSIGGIIYFVVGLIPVFLGLMAFKLLPDLQTASAEEAEQVIARLAREFMPGVLYVTFVGAIISAVLSVVHSALHAPAAQVSHNIVVRVIPDLSDKAKLWSVRLTVMVLCIITYLISVTAEGVRELVETASAFGSAGVFVATLFALFTRYGGPLSAYLSIIAGMLVWAGGKFVLGLSTPYLIGLVSAAAAYVGGALMQPSAK